MSHLLDSSLVGSGADEWVRADVSAHHLPHPQRLGLVLVLVMYPLQWGRADHAPGGGGGDAVAGRVWN